MDNARKLPFAQIEGVEGGRSDESARGDFGAGPFKLLYGADEYDGPGRRCPCHPDGMEPIPPSRPARIAAAMRGRHFFDFRNLYEPGDVAKFGFTYEGVGTTRVRDPDPERGARQMTFKCLMIMGLLLVSIGCRGKAPDPLDVSYRKLRDVPREKWDKLSQKKIFFGHQSVGRNILEGLEKVLKAVPEIRLEIKETSDPRDFQGPVFAHARIGQNRDPQGKIEHFRRISKAASGRPRT